MDEDLTNLSEQVEKEIKPIFEKVDKVCEYNSQKVLEAFQECQLQEVHFNSSTGYGIEELGRNKIEEIYINSLDTKAIVARLGGEFSDTIWDVRFDYNNVSYHLELFFFTSGNHRDELLKILNSFNN